VQLPHKSPCGLCVLLRLHLCALYEFIQDVEGAARSASFLYTGGAVFRKKDTGNGKALLLQEQMDVQGSPGRVAEHGLRDAQEVSAAFCVDSVSGAAAVPEEFHGFKIHVVLLVQSV
jgi:hypothetical protein